ncbi:hypothetical protein ARMGADRAFT_608291 [Armillaria gallica]|uniref:F-box domain-containing protein n=1 Tax=Armillaria gallica TaxID=47427 RepID=A0A2H3D7U5_ARMGA|nr:hypothetical protein ARMGADRAFT_608291 [Armillaria gallica]
MTTARVQDSIIQQKSPLRSRRLRRYPELIDVIIDYLCNDIQSLRACALVASSWSGRSQQNLFSRITLAGRPWPDKSKGRTSAELLLRLIESVPHTIPNFVQHLEIIEGDVFKCDRWLGQSIPVLDRILLVLTNLRTFHISFNHALWRDVPGIHNYILSTSKLSDLRKVTITNLPDVSSWDLLFTLFEGSNVADICLTDVITCALTDSSQTYGPGSVRIPLETLSLSLSSDELWRFSSWLADPSCVLQVDCSRKLRVNIVYSQEMKAFSRLLETLHMSSLQVIEIRLIALSLSAHPFNPNTRRPSMRAGGMDIGLSCRQVLGTVVEELRRERHRECHAHAPQDPSEQVSRRRTNVSDCSRRSSDPC